MYRHRKVLSCSRRRREAKRRQPSAVSSGFEYSKQPVRPPVPAVHRPNATPLLSALHQHRTGHEQRGGSFATSDRQRAVDDARFAGKGCWPRVLFGDFRVVHRRRRSPLSSRLSPGVLHAGLEVRFSTQNSKPDAPAPLSGSFTAPALRRVLSACLAGLLFMRFERTLSLVLVFEL